MWPPSTDEREVRTSPPSPSDRLERVRFALATRHHLGAVQPSIPGRCFPVGSWCCRTTLDLFSAYSDGRMACKPRLLRHIKPGLYRLASGVSMLSKVSLSASLAITRTDNCPSRTIAATISLCFLAFGVEPRVSVRHMLKYPLCLCV